jgi:hypothetical protein
MKRPGALSLVFVCILASCQTLQRDIEFSSVDESALTDITALEDRIVRLDRGYTRQELAGIRRQITDLERKSIQDEVYKARVAALSGRLFLFEGKNSDAGRQLSLSEDLDAGNVQARVLSIRREQDPQRRLALIDSYPEADSAGELQIERGLVLSALQRFSEAVAAFDTAFAQLSGREVYRETYQAGRDQAWELRDTAGIGNSTAEIVRRPAVTWRDIIELTKNETGLLRFLTAGRDFPTGELFNRLLERSFIPLSQNVNLKDWPAAKPALNDTVLRGGAAWYLWRLLAENRADRGLLTRYSSRYVNRPNAASPILDIPLGSPYFDSVLGCVEREIMALPDGKNFVPNETIRGAAFLAMLKKL